MPNVKNAELPSIDDAIVWLLDDLGVVPEEGERRDYGYHVGMFHASQRFAQYLIRSGQFDDRTPIELETEVGPIIMEAAWQLCRRGILRPGVLKPGFQAEDAGGYCLTEYGKQYLASRDSDVILQSGSLAKVFRSFEPLFGSGFHQRSQEAIRCRQAEAWLACCTMVGAAAESIALAAAVAKVGDEDKVLDVYFKRDGRRNLLKIVADGQKGYVQRNLQTYMGLLSYWRDDASHGQATSLDLANADEALRQLLHLCQWMQKNWDTLTR